MLSHEEIFRRVRHAISEALNLDDEEVGRTARLAPDLGAESLDFLDIVFRIEQAFSFKIPRGELFPSREFFERYARGEHITEKGLEELRKFLALGDVAVVARDPRWPQVLENLFTVDYICRYVERKCVQLGR